MKAKILSQTTKVQFPRGRYFIGDPCYCFGDKTWNEIGRQTNGFHDTTIMAELGEFTMWSEGTAYGDGEYHDQHGNSYSVDAGLIGVTPMELVEDKGYDLSDLGLVYEFHHEFTVESDGHGRFNIGHIIIDTAVEYDEFDEDDEDWY